jgi:polar amino acid transport system substrate-binding protein
MKKVKCGLLVAMFALMGINCFAGELRLVTTQYPPYVFEADSKEVNGVVLEIVKETFKRMGQPIKIEMLPWARALKYMEDGDADGVFTAYKTPEREVFLDYSKEVLIPQIISLFVKKDASIVFDGDFSKLNKYKFGVARKISYGGKFDAAVKNKIITNLEEVSEAEQNFQKLVLSRVDIVISNKYGGINIINKLKKSKEIKELLPEVQNIPCYIAFSKKNNLSKIRDDFDKTLKTMKKDGTYDKIITDFFLE